MTTSTFKKLAGAASILALTACGGGGGGSSSAAAPAPAPAAGGGTTPTTSKDLAQGTITGFGSVYLDGQKFETDDALFYKDGDDSAQGEFRVGMKVKISGDFDDDRADIVSYDEDVKGPVDRAYEASSGTLVVMGQTVLVTAETRLDDGLDLNSILVGDLLEVSGYRGVGDVIEATYMERKRDDDINAFKVIGQIRDLDTNAREFSIGGLRIGYADAELDDVGPLANDLLVEVKDAGKGYAPGLFTLQATKVEGESYGRPDELSDDDSGDRLELEGVVSAVGENSFELGGLEVRYDAQTLFIYGDATQLEAGTKVKVEGQLSDAGTLDAYKVKFSRNAVRISAVVDMIDYDARVVTLLGLAVLIPEDADLEDDRGNSDSLAFEDLMQGDFVEIRGRFTADGVIASELERDEVGDTELRGVATAIDAQSATLDILGVPVVTSGSTKFEIDDDDNGVDDGFDDSASAADFFALLNDGQSVVEAKWDGVVVDTSAVAAEELELED